MSILGILVVILIGLLIFLAIIHDPICIFYGVLILIPLIVFTLINRSEMEDMRKKV